MGRPGLLIGEIAARCGMSRKAIRLYEQLGILAQPVRTPGGYRLYGEEALRVLAFVRRAQRLGLSLAEIREIVAIKGTGKATCARVRALLQHKLADLDRLLAELTASREALGSLLASWRSRASLPAKICPQIERGKEVKACDGHESVALPRLQRLPGGRSCRRWRPDRGSRQ